MKRCSTRQFLMMIETMPCYLLAIQLIFCHASAGWHPGFKNPIKMLDASLRWHDKAKI